MGERSITERMHHLCSDDEYRETITSPFRVDYDGATWAAATDGGALVMLRTKTPPEKTDGLDVVSIVLSQDWHHEGVASVARIVAALDPCVMCGGGGLCRCACRGLHSCGCVGHGDGGKQITVGPAVLDAVLLARFLAMLDGVVDVSTSGKRSTVMFRGAEGLVCAMPLQWRVECWETLPALDGVIHDATPDDAARGEST